MPQEFHVLRCFSCSTFQVHQVKKALKWNCKLCGEKQSVKKVYGRGSGADCRRHVQKLNMLRGDIEDAQQDTSEFQDLGEHESSHSDLSQHIQGPSKWSNFVETVDEEPEGYTFSDQHMLSADMETFTTNRSEFCKWKSQSKKSAKPRHQEYGKQVYGKSKHCGDSTPPPYKEKHRMQNVKPAHNNEFDSSLTEHRLAPPRDQTAAERHTPTYSTSRSLGAFSAASRDSSREFNTNAGNKTGPLQQSAAVCGIYPLKPPSSRNVNAPKITSKWSRFIEEDDSDAAETGYETIETPLSESSHFPVDKDRWEGGISLCHGTDTPNFSLADNFDDLIDF